MLTEAADTVVLSRSEHAALLADRAALVALQAAFEKLQLQFQTLLRQRFGSTSESADQLMLFGANTRVAPQPRRAAIDVLLATMMARSL